MEPIAFVDLNAMHAPLRAEMDAAWKRVMDASAFIGGPEVKAFERAMSETLGGVEVCGVSCATLGLFSTLRAFGVGPGDEVITTPHTAIATAEAVSLTGARVVFADLKDDAYVLDPDAVERKLTARTKAVMPVHLYGQPADMDAFLALKDKHGFVLIEDCAQAQGARHRGRPVGTMGDAGVFSFFPSKNLGGFGDGGAVCARDPAMLKRIRMFSNHGREDKYIHEFEGINSRLDALQAALLRVCLTQLETWNARRREVAALYDERLADCSALALPTARPETEPVFHLYVVLAPDRKALRAHLKEQGIGTGVHYPHALNTQPAYAYLNEGFGSYPRAEYVCEHCVSLPMHPGLSEAQVDRVTETIQAFYAAGA